MTAQVELAADRRGTLAAPIEPHRVLDDLEAGRVRAAEPDPTAVE